MRNTPIGNAAVAFVLVLGLGACASAPIYNVTDAPVSTAFGKALQPSGWVQNLDRGIRSALSTL